MTTIQEEADKLLQEASEKLAEADNLTKLHEAHPDLQKHVNRWRKVRFYSKQVNTLATRFDIGHSCGCCNDSTLEVWPYIETEHGKVYSDPPRFQVGEKHWIAGDTPYPAWKDQLREAGIPESIIGAVQAHFDQGKQDRIALAEGS